MKKIILLAAVALLCTTSLFAQKETAKAQKIVKTEHGDISIGILIPDRGMADPHVWIENGRLYTFCGGDKSWEPVNTWIMDRWELWSTDDLVNWQHELTIKPTETYIGDKPNCWAGDICERNGKYYWFFSNRNLNTGVMVADKITGPYKDLLGKPLLTPDMAKTHPYDPEIYIDEEGEYHICFGAGVYYMARLSEDMKSLKEKPRAISVKDKDGKHFGMGDKPTLFKRGDWYYLVSGGRYAMSKELYGPYDFKGSLGGGGHCSFFTWNDVWYRIHETSDTNCFYRGVGLQPVYFNEDGTIAPTKIKAVHPGNGRDYTFGASEMGWHATSGTTLKYDKSTESIKGDISEKNAAIESAIFLMSEIKDLKEVKIEIRNETKATKLRIGMMSYMNPRTNPKEFYWNVYPVKSDWSQGSFVEVEMKPNSKKMQQFTIPISQFKGLKQKLMQVRVEPACNASKGSWEIDNLIVR
ncbi:MAG: family 43 glycosylhydrolase [Rikenellaceae bacterium]